MRSRRDSALKPPKTTLCTAPMRVQASMAIGSSGIIGKIDRHSIALSDSQAS